MIAMDTELLKILGQVAGIGGIGAGILLIIYKEIIRKNIFPNLKKDHAYYLLRLIAILVWSIAAIGIGGWIFIEYTKNSNVHKVEGKSDTWIRMKYMVCTGPYNHVEGMLGTTQKEREKEDSEGKNQKRHLINNNIIKSLRKFGALQNGGKGVVTDIILGSKDIKKYFNVKYNGASIENNIKKYFNFFSKIPVDIDFLKIKKLFLIIKEIKNANQSYNEGIGFSVDQNPCSYGDVNVTFYFRSLRTKFVIFENVSGEILKNIVFHVQAYEPVNMLELRTGKNKNIEKRLIAKKLIFQ